ncbi:toll/interleukin-1 receptor domain-containing protein [Cryptosporangium japonicum]|uniref:TIR domain-containing protein n=1 Tax=Cryptosporangium japonicum TaxID=80872 RepID=A0ABN0V7E0_9ACTN
MTHVRYHGFLSYARAADDGRARAVKHALERYARPWYRFAALRICLDETNFAAGGDVEATIAEKLERSDFLIVLASRPAATSVWMAFEVRHWLAHGGSPDRLVVVSTDLAPRDAGGPDGTMADRVPEQLRDTVAQQLVVDLSWLRGVDRQDLADPRWSTELAKLSGRLHDVDPEEIAGEERRQRQVFHRLRRLAIAGLAVLTVLSVTLATVAVAQTRSAREERAAAVRAEHVARSRQLAAASVEIGETDADLAKQIAIVAYREWPTTEAAAAVLSTAPRPGTIVLPGPARSPRFSRDGRYLAVRYGTSTPGVVVRDLVRRRTVADLALEGPDEVVGLAYGGSGTLVVLARSTGLELWRVGDGRLTRVRGVTGLFPGETPSAVAMSPDGHTVVVGGTRGGVVAVDVSDPANPVAGPVRAGGRPARTVEYAPDGRTVAVADDTGGVALWTPDGAGALTRRGALPGGTAPVSGLQFGPEGTTLVTATSTGAARLWDLAAGTVPTRPVVSWSLGTGASGFVALAPDGRTLAVAVGTDTVGLWDLTDPYEPRSRPPLTIARADEYAPLAALRYRPGTSTLLVGEPGGPGLEQWDLATPAQQGALAALPYDSPLSGNAAPAAVDPAHERIATVSSQQVCVVAVGDLRRPVATPDGCAPIDRALGTTFSADGTRLVTSTAAEGPDQLGAPAAVRIFDAGPGRGRLALRTAFTVPGTLWTPTFRLTLRPDGARLALTSSGGVEVWDVSGAPRRLARVAARDVGPIGFLGADHLVFGTGPGALGVWRIGGPGFRRIATDGFGVDALAVSPDGHAVATASRGGVRLHRVDGDTLTPTAALPGSEARRPGFTTANQVVFGRDSRRLVTVGGERGLRLWDVADLDRPVRLLSYPGGAAPAGLSPDGRLLIGQSPAGLTIWDTSVEPAITVSCGTVGEPVTRAEWRMYVPDRGYRPPCP